MHRKLPGTFPDNSEARFTPLARTSPMPSLFAIFLVIATIAW